MYGHGLGFGFYWDPTYILIVIGFVLALIAQFGVKSTYAKYSTVTNARHLTGAEAARRILDANGLQHIRIEHIGGQLSDHYSPNENVIRLSDSTYQSDSVAALGVAAHECGHAVQYQQGYQPIKIRNGIVPVVNIGNMASMPLFFIGLLFNSKTLAMVGIVLFSLVLVFQLVTLPVEFNASSRALKTLSGMGLLSQQEIKGASAVLKAAAMTYVAAAASSLLSLLRLILIFNSRTNRRD